MFRAKREMDFVSTMSPFTLSLIQLHDSWEVGANGLFLGAYSETIAFGGKRHKKIAAFRSFYQ